MRAYETLKDEEKRKYYDVHGEDQESWTKKQYQSYTYYRDQFGIYDDDQEIVTLSYSDFGLYNFIKIMFGECVYKLLTVYSQR